MAYALEGSVFVSGAGVQWLRDGLRIIDAAAELEPLARSVDSSDGVVVVPAFSGLGSPTWDPTARGTITGLSRGTGRPHLARAMVEAMAFQARDVLDAMATTGIAPTEVRVDGGAAVMGLLLQQLADQVTPRRPSSRLGRDNGSGCGHDGWPRRGNVAVARRSRRPMARRSLLLPRGRARGDRGPALGVESQRRTIPSLGRRRLSAGSAGRWGNPRSSGRPARPWSRSTGARGCAGPGRRDRPRGRGRPGPWGARATPGLTGPDGDAASAVDPARRDSSSASGGSPSVASALPATGSKTAAKEANRLWRAWVASRTRSSSRVG